MRCLALLFGLLVLQQGHCFEFLVEGDWETEMPLKEQHGRFKRGVLTNEEQEDFEAVQGDDITVESYRVESRITSRFCHTTFKSFVVNSGPNAQSIGFHVQIPKRAFITNFTMNVNGVTFVGSVKEKTVARNLYAQARARGKAAGIVRANSQDMETFKAEVHVPSGNRIEFELHYQEMMYRKLGLYEHTLHLQPGRLVPRFQLDVYIYEPNGIASVEVPNTLGEHFTGLAQVTSNKHKAHVVFKPSLKQQRKCDNCTTSALSGIFTVKYDVIRESAAGELHVSDGHFVHFFAPTNLSPLPKNIVFVIDVSGSMWGVKMKQTVEAMQAILDDLTMDDYFSIIDFNHNVRCWSDELVQGSTIQVAEAKKYIQDIKPNGGTNINEALLRAGQILHKAANQGMLNSRSVSMIILVSDGDPTVGEIKLSAIQKNVKKIMREDFSLFSLGIGFDVDYDFLERIATENRGVAQRIYANKDASEQLRRFYSQVSSPLLRKITVLFPEGSVSDVTQNSFDKYFSGSELVVAGKVLPSDGTSLNSFITASSVSRTPERLRSHTHSLAHTYQHSKHLPIWFHCHSVIYLGQLCHYSNSFLWVFCLTVDNDPHFIIHLPKNNMDVCFNIDSKPGHILNLVSDPGTGVVVNGQLVGSKRVGVEKENVKTYFGTISVFSKLDGIMVTVSTDRIQLTDSKHNHSFSWGATADITQDRVKVSIVKDSQVTVTVDEKIRVMMLLHRVWKKHPTSVDFLGLYIPNSNQYSSKAHGLIGQFGQEPEVRVYNLHQGADPLKKEATMEVKGNKLAVTRGWQKDYRRDKKRGSDIFCWFIHNSGKGFIDGHYTTYIVPRLDSFLQRPL
uniref:Inter-alpha-trypsin inhibitor heavy chain 2 n=1 Tax=Esox lucius TaxID=8010 RepID=A0A6Q2Y641_ESOLU